MKETRIQRAKLNAGTTLLNQLVYTLCGLIIPWIMIDTFGSVAYGLTTSIAQFLSYISLFEGGIGRVARGELYKPLAQKDTTGVSKIYLAVKRMFRNIGIAFIGYTLILAVFYKDIASVTEFSRYYVFAMVIAISIGKLAEYMGGIANVTLFNADQRQYAVNAVIIFSNIANALVVVLLVTLGCDILWVKLGSGLVFAIKPIIYIAYRNKHYNIVKTKEKFVLKNRWTGLGQHMAYFVHTNTDVFILTIFSDFRMVAVYSVYNLVIASMRNITTAFTGGMEAVFGDMIAKKEKTSLISAYDKYKLLLTILTIVLFGVTAILIVPFVQLYTAGVNDADYTQPAFAIILMLAEAVTCLVLPCTNLPIAANKLKESRFGAYGEAIINMVISLILVFWNPLVGIALGTFISALFKGVYYIVFSAKHILKQSVVPMLSKFFGVVLSLVLISVGGMIIVQHIAISNFLIWAVCGVVCVVIVGAISLIVGQLLYPGKIKDVVSVVLKKNK